MNLHCAYNIFSPLNYLQTRQLKDIELIKKFKIGFVDGTLLEKISPESEEYKYLKEIGIIKSNQNKSITQNYEYFKNYIIFPFFDEQENIGEVYGRSILANTKIPHKYLPGSHSGVFNPKALKVFDEIYLCECVIDALSLYTMGFHNVTCTFGKGSITDELFNLLTEQIKKIVICFDNDGEDDSSAELLAQRFIKKNCNVSRLNLPKEIKDINELLIKKSTNNNKTLAEIKKEFSSLPQKDYTFKVNLKNENPEGKSNNQKENIDNVHSKELTLIKDEYGIMLFKKEEREYIIKKLRRDTLLNLKLSLKVTADHLSYLEEINLERPRDKEFFSRRAKERIGSKISEYDLLGDLEEITWYLEKFQEDLYVKNQLQANDFMGTTHTMSAEEEQKAKELLKKKDYLTEIFLPDMDYMGLKGERNNLLLYMICAISRLDMYPAHILVVAPFGSGKSELQKSVLKLLPKNDVFRLSRSTEQVLYYLDEDGLDKKVISLDEIDGASENKYSFRTLMSERRLEILYTDKDDQGQLKAKHKVVKGQTSVFLATTDADKIDAETKSRMLVVYGDDSSTQTRNIMESQFISDNTEQGGEIRELKEEVIKKHQDIHSVIKPLSVFFPLELKEKILKMEARLIARRNFRSYGTVVRSIALSRQYRREIFKNKNDVEYILVKEEDVLLANELLEPVFADQQADLKGPLRSFYEKILDFVDDKKGQLRRVELDFTAREIRQWINGEYTQTYKNLTKLVELEYIVKIKGKPGQTNIYKLLDEK